MFRPSYFSLVTLACIALNVQAQDLDALKLDTRKQALPVLPKVVAMMKETVVAKGAVDAIPVCKDKAPQLIKEQSDKTGWQMHRVSLKTRNPERGAPDVWEARQLADFNIRATNGEKPDTLEAGEIVSENGKQVYRYMKAIPVGEVCLACHGAREGLDAALKDQLARSYPHDRAVDYQLGQIRGALSVRRPL